MLIIDTESESRLIKQLQRLRDERAGWRAVHLHLESLTAEQRQDELNQFAAACEAGDLQAYMLQQGDVLLLVQDGAARSLRQAAMALNTRQQKTLIDPLVDIHELGYGWPRVMGLAGERQDQIDAAERTAKARAKAQELAQARQLILNLPVDPQQIGSIHERRGKHEKPVIMVVEDEPFSARLVESVLGAAHTVHLASDGQSAMLNYARWAPHVLFLDIDLPDVSGYDVMRRIRSFDPQAYVIMLSSHADRSHILQSRELGAQGFVGKPFTRDKLGQYIQRCPLLALSRTGGAS